MKTNYLLKVSLITAIYFCLSIFCNTAKAQNVGINSTGATPNASALLDVDAAPANNKGILIPRVSLTSTVDVTTIASPATSLLVYNTNVAMTGGGLGFFYWDGAAWSRVGANTICGTANTNSVTKFTSPTTICNSIISDDGTKVGVATSTANTVLDVNGSFAYREGTAISLANGANNNVAIGSYSYFRITGPTATYTISGLTGGVDGRIVTLFNTTSQPMTILNNATSTAGNQITTMLGANITTPAGPNIIQLQYNANLSKWLVIGGQNITSSGSSGNSHCYTCDGF